MIAEECGVEMKTQEEWYKKDISQGVVCWVRNDSSSKWMIDIIVHHFEYGMFLGATGKWVQAEPLYLDKPLLEQLTGISDIIRGSSVASETATAQSIKSQ